MADQQVSRKVVVLRRCPVARRMLEAPIADAART